LYDWQHVAEWNPRIKIALYVTVPYKLTFMESPPIINSTQFFRTISERSYMATARLDMRLSEEIKAKAEKASALLGHKSLTEYVVKIMDEHASHVIAQCENITVKNNVFDVFWEACNKASKPSKALKSAVTYVKEQDFT
jgi:uncharacterized protein (DUF1778 family)